MGSALTELELTNRNTPAAMVRINPCFLLIERRFILFSFQTPVGVAISTDSVNTVAGYTSNVACDQVATPLIRKFDEKPAYRIPSVRIMIRAWRPYFGQVRENRGRP